MDSRHELDDLAADLAALQRRITNVRALQQTERASDLQAWVNYAALAPFSGEASRHLPKLKRNLDGSRRTKRKLPRPVPVDIWPLPPTPPRGVSLDVRVPRTNPHGIRRIPRNDD